MIKVKAETMGFFGKPRDVHRRIKEGTEFTIDSIEQYGQWMKLLEPTAKDLEVLVKRYSEKYVKGKYGEIKKAKVKNAT